MKIVVTWDSGPYGIYYPDTRGEKGAVEVPDEVFERYEKADEELRSAQDALDEAIEKAERAAR